MFLVWKQRCGHFKIGWLPGILIRERNKAKSSAKQLMRPDSNGSTNHQHFKCKENRKCLRIERDDPFNPWKFCLLGDLKSSWHYQPFSSWNAWVRIPLKHNAKSLKRRPSSTSSAANAKNRNFYFHCWDLVDEQCLANSYNRFKLISCDSSPITLPIDISDISTHHVVMEEESSWADWTFTWDSLQFSASVRKMSLIGLVSGLIFPGHCSLVQKLENCSLSIKT